MKTFNIPLVSVVVPCLNRAHFLIPTIESILQQDYPHIECIVIDGGSTDETIKILKNYGNRIKWISEPDNGHADAINKGWWMSKGEILAWLNADDCYVVPDAVRKAVDYFESHPEVDVVYGNMAKISEDGKVISEVIKPREWDLVYAVKYCHFTIHQPASFIRRSILEKVGWLDVGFIGAKDHELWLRIGLVGTIRYAPLFFAFERKCKGISQQLDLVDYKVKLTKKFFKMPNLPMPFNMKAFQNRSLSNSYLVSALYTLDCGIDTKSLVAFLRYLLKAITKDPLNLPYITLKTFIKIIRIILPDRLKQIIKRIKNVLVDKIINLKNSRRGC